MNLFAVLVGETSKARKGTAWAHVRRLFKRADEQWAQDCIANGLSSGEGVIWAVRDPITKDVKNKKTGSTKRKLSMPELPTNVCALLKVNSPTC